MYRWAALEKYIVLKSSTIHFTILKKDEEKNIKKSKYRHLQF